LQGAEVIALVCDVGGGAGVGTDVVHRQHFQCLHRAATFLADGGHVAAGAVLGEQRAALSGEGLVDRPEQFFGPGGRFEALQGFFDQVEVAHSYAGRVTRIALKRLASAIEKR